jgi:hypothetical protein
MLEVNLQIELSLRKGEVETRPSIVIRTRQKKRAHRLLKVVPGAQRWTSVESTKTRVSPCLWKMAVVAGRTAIMVAGRMAILVASRMAIMASRTMIVAIRTKKKV